MFILPKEAKVDIDVIAKDKLRLPPRINVHMLEAPPPGDTPVKNMPNRIAGSSGNMRKPNPNDI